MNVFSRSGDGPAPQNHVGDVVVELSPEEATKLVATLEVARQLCVIGWHQAETLADSIRRVLPPADAERRWPRIDW
jgi:hypothetical protein